MKKPFTRVNEYLLDGKKKCKGCKKVKLLGEFYFERNNADRRKGKCKICYVKQCQDRVSILEKDPGWLKHRRKIARKSYAKNGRPPLSFRQKRMACAAVLRHRTKNPQQYAAQKAVHRAISKGKLQKGLCEVCGTDSNIHAHHEDYEKPLMVKWLCIRHHADHHIEQREKLK